MVPMFMKVMTAVTISTISKYSKSNDPQRIQFACNFRSRGPQLQLGGNEAAIISIISPCSMGLTTGRPPFTNIGIGHLLNIPAIYRTSEIIGLNIHRVSPHHSRLICIQVNFLQF